jgi:predicted transposase YdaD
LLPLTKDGATQEVVEEVISKLLAAKEEQAQTNLFPIAFTLSSLALDTPEEKEWLIRRFRMLEDMLQETVIYQYILQQGVAKGEQQGLEKGLQQELQDLRRLLLSSIRSKFPDLVSLAAKHISGVVNAELLMDLTLKVITAQTAEEFSKVLAKVNERSK